MLPDRVRYSAVLLDWVEQDITGYRQRIEGRLSLVEQSLGMRLAPLRRAVTERPPLRLFPARLPSGQLSRQRARLLSEASGAWVVDYARGQVATPETLELTANAPGIANAVLWTQELIADDRVLFSNESISWIATPCAVGAGDTLRLSIDDRFRRENVLGCQRVE